MTDVLTQFDPAYVLAGFVVGAFIGITGVGGGSLMTPLLIIFGVHPAMAVGTDLFYAAATKSFGTLVHGFNQSVDWTIVRRLAMGSIPGAALTLVLLSLLSIGSVASQLLITRVLGVALLVTAATIILRRPMAAMFAPYAGMLAPQKVARLTIASGVLLGVLVSISSVGAGAIGASLLVLLYPRHPMARIVGTDIAHAVPLALIAGLGHLAVGTIDWMLLAVLLLGSLPGILIGSYLAARLPDRAVRITLAGALVMACARMLF
ncbi:MAG: sulfite exporter TauE/SafE family protein, partial [Alphaproteobacteria bacterium]|nr:sulfite exporter TauE/SafE family protein [Alphaproteobacteria bacterium]